MTETKIELYDEVMNKGFTLIELLVVIAIIGTLAAVLFPNFISARQRANDSVRKSDLSQIQKALELYKQDQSTPTYPGSLPSGNTCWGSGNACTCGVEGACSGSIYMNKFPQDPSSTTSTIKQYYYALGVDGTTYVLSACLDNAADKNGATCPGAYSCSSSKCYSITQP